VLGARRDATASVDPSPRISAYRSVPVVGAAVLLVGFLVTAALSVLSYIANSRNEDHLLSLQTAQAAAVLQLAVPAVQTPLTSAAEIAEASNANVVGLRAYLSHYVGAHRSLADASLWRLGTSPRLVAVLGGTRPPASPGLASFVRSATDSTQLVVGGRLSGPDPMLWYAATATRRAPRYAIFADAALPPDRRAVVQPGSAFSELHFALYLGARTVPSALLESDVSSLPIRGRTSTVRIPFGTSQLTFVATPAQRLGGALSAWLWWLVAAVGGVISVVAALLAERLIKRRRSADLLRAQVEELLGEQRTIAESLQRALLPEALPTIDDVDIAARYVPGARGAEIGGDWYEVVALDDGCLFVVIGDVSGRGIPAAAVMASLRFAIRGFVSEGHSPEQVLTAASRLLDMRVDRHFATVLCGLVDRRGGRLTLASAGHLPPVMRTDTMTILGLDVGPPIGVAKDFAYRSTTVQLPEAATLLLFTDGLVERRGEDLDQSFARLAELMSHSREPLEQLVDDLVAELVPDEAADDTALVGIAWR
jgi:serine phosphatase RsbU (regulator of sigma subunit)/type II secretory pathway pseudopilin PulG